jgi:hypothetical protein
MGGRVLQRTRLATVILMRKLLTAAATVLALLACASPALGSGKTVLDDCSDDEVLSKTYTQQEYRDALAQLPADADQYGNCRDVIARAQDAAATKGGSKDSGTGGTSGATPGAGGSGGGGGDGPSTAPAADQLAAASAEDRAAAADAARAPSGAAAGAEPVVIASDVGRAPGSDAGAGLPTPLIVLLALLFVGALALAASRIQSLVNTRRA